MQQNVDLTPGFHIPKANKFVAPCGEHRLPVRQHADRSGAIGMSTQDEAFLALALTPQVTPLPVAQVDLGGASSTSPWLGHLFLVSERSGTRGARPPEIVDRPMA